MSKKSRRFRTPNLPPEAYTAATSSSEPAEVLVAAAAGAAPSSEVALDLRGEYKEVLGDLRKTFIIFISMVVAMLALSFVI
jgi:hypothetical protein